AHAPSADEVCEAHPRALDLAHTRLAPQLEGQLVDLCETGRATGMTARDQPAIGVEGDAAAQLGFAGLEQLLCITGWTEAEELIVLKLLVREGVVHERDVYVRRAEPRLLIGLQRR